MARFYRPELDALRFGAFFIVFAAHTCQSLAVEMYNAGGLSAFIEEASIGGLYGVDLFFILSAYLICELFRREREETGGINVKAFYGRRVLRIWPLYYVFVLTVAVASLVVTVTPMPRPALVSLLFFYSNWYLAWNASFPPADLLWSVSAEEQFYLFCPLAMRFLSPRRLLICAIGVVIFAFISRSTFMSHGDG